MFQKVIYPDGSFYPIIEEFNPEFTFRINSYEDLWLLSQIRDVYKANNKNAIVTIPNILDGQADSRFHSNESFNLKLVCKFLNEMGWEKIKIFHPHNASLIEGIIDNVSIIDNTFFLKSVLNDLFKIQIGGWIDEGLWHHKKLENTVLLSPDAGMYKYLMKSADSIGWEGEVEAASKSRKYENGKSILTQKLDRLDFQGKDIVIIDDICVRGGTFLGLAKLLKERNVGKLYLAASHITIVNPNPTLFDVFDGVYTTNSKGLTYIIEDHPSDFIPSNLTILNLFE